MFQILKAAKVNCSNANARPELHGTERVRAIDLAFCLTGENTLLDLIQEGLREHHYFNKALKEGQEALPGVLIPLPNLRFPRLPLTYHFAKGEKWRGYRWVWDFGIDEAHIDFTDAVLSNLHYELLEGGTVKIFFTVSFNGDELNDNEIYGELSSLASEGEVTIQLIPPAELIPAKKGYRAGKADTPQPPAGDGQTGNLLEPDGGGGEPGAAGGEAGDGGSNPVSPIEAMKQAHGVGEGSTAAAT